MSAKRPRKSASSSRIRRIAAALPGDRDGTELREWLLLQTCAVCGPGLGSVDVRELSPGDRELFEEAALRAVVAAKSEDAADWHRPSAFTGWLEHFEILSRLIESVRAGDDPESYHPHTTGLIAPSGERVGPGWKRLGHDPEAR